MKVMYFTAVCISVENMRQADPRMHIWHCPQYYVCVCLLRLVHFVSQLNGF